VPGPAAALHAALEVEGLLGVARGHLVVARRGVLLLDREHGLAGMPSIFFSSSAIEAAKGFADIWAVIISCQPLRSPPTSCVTHITWVIEPPIGMLMVVEYLVASQSLTFIVSVEGVTVTFCWPTICSIIGARAAPEKRTRLVRRRASFMEGSWGSGMRACAENRARA
jgi:hypothetical protein